jgi:MFS family permease
MRGPGVRGLDVRGLGRSAPVLAAYAGSVVVEWAIWVVALVYAFEEGGPTLAGFTSLALLGPSVLVAPLAARVADGRRPGLVLFRVYGLQALLFAGLTLLTALHVAAPLVIAASAVVVGTVTFVRPCVAVVVPSLVVRPEELVRANLVTGNADSASVLAGPLIASALLAAQGVPLALAVCAAVSAGCAVLSRPVAVREGHRPAPPAEDGGSLVKALRGLASQRGASTLLLVLGGQFVLIGGLDLLYVVLAFDELHLDGAGAGILSATFGVGALLGGLATTRLVARPGLARVLVAALALIGAAMIALGAWTTLALTLGLLVVTGVARSVLDVTGRLLLQRIAPQHLLASAFVLLEVVMDLGTLVGSVLVQVLVAVSGAPAAALALGLLFAVLAVTCAPGLRYADQHADVPVVAIRLLREVPLFAPLPAPEIETLARGARLSDVADGAVILREGDVGDEYLVVAEGTVEVSTGGEFRRVMGRGEGFGEIALLADVPRTATVVARGPVTVLAVDRGGFLSAVAGHDASAAVAWSVARGWHPGLADGDE